MPAASSASAFAWAVPLELRKDVDEVRPGDRVTSDADARRLTYAALSQLVDDLIRQRSRPRHEADRARLADLARDDADVGLARRDEAGTVRSNEGRGVV